METGFYVDLLWPGKTLTCLWKFWNYFFFTSKLGRFLFVSSALNCWSPGPEKEEKTRKKEAVTPRPFTCSNYKNPVQNSSSTQFTFSSSSLQLSTHLAPTQNEFLQNCEYLVFIRYFKIFSLQCISGSKCDKVKCTNRKKIRGFNYADADRVRRFGR